MCVFFSLAPFMYHRMSSIVRELYAANAQLVVKREPPRMESKVIGGEEERKKPASRQTIKPKGETEDEIKP